MIALLIDALKSHLLNLAATLGLLLGVAACTTSPVSEHAVVSPATPAASAAARPVMPPQPTLLPGQTAPEGSPTDTPVQAESPLTDESRPALLGGEAVREFERGGASWYGPGFHGRRTASGERFNMHALTAAHRTLPFGTLVRVRSLANGREVDVRINDRGPFSRNRVIDVSRAAAQTLGMLGLGLKEVVLLVPESTQAAAEVQPGPVKKPRWIRRPSPSSEPH